MDVSSWQQRLDDARGRYAVPGVQLGLLRAGERAVVCAGSLAPGSTQPVVADTAFHAGSLAKSLTGLVVLDAARRGEIDLDVPCSDQAEGLWDDTPRALLAQTTGRQNLLPELDESLAAFVARTADEPRVHAPGRFSYCNAGWSVLDLLLHLRAGSSFEERATSVLGELVSWTPTFGMPDGATTPYAAAPDGSLHEVPAQFATAASAAGSRWWATADQLLDWAAVQLAPPAGWEAPAAGLRAHGADLPGATVFDAWGHGWALWDRGAHRAFGWAGFTGGHRAYLRCFPDQDAALVVLASSAGPLFGPPGGSALFDDLLPDLLDALGVPPLPALEPVPGPPVAELVGQYGPVPVTADDADDAGDPDVLVADVSAMGGAQPVRFRRTSGAAFEVDGNPPGSIGLSFDGDLAYLGPFALPRL